MKVVLYFFLLLINSNLFAQEILFKPVFLDQCTGEVSSYVSYSLRDSNATYHSKRNTKYLILPKKGTYWLQINTKTFDELPIKLTIEAAMNVDSFYVNRRVAFRHSCQRMCQEIFEKEPENFIGKYNSHYRLCDKPIANKLMFDLYFNEQVRIVGTFNENGQAIDTLKKYYSTGALAELSIYNSKAEPQLVLSYYENGGLKLKLDFVKGIKLQKYPSGQVKLNTKFKASTYSEFGKGLDTLKEYYDSGALKELIAYDSENEPQLIVSYYEDGVIRARLDFKKGIGIGLYPSGKKRIQSTFRRLPPYAVFAVTIKEFYENGQLKSNGIYDRKRPASFYGEEDYILLGLRGATNFESYYEDGQLELISRGKYSLNGLKMYYRNGQLKIKQRPKIRRIYDLDRKLIEKIRKTKRVYSHFEIETFQITYTRYYNWKWTTFDSLRKKKRKIVYSPFCDDPSCAFPDSLENSKLETDSYYKVLIFEEGKRHQKIEVNSEEIELYEWKEKKWIEIKKLPKENIYKLLEELGVN